MTEPAPLQLTASLDRPRLGRAQSSAVHLVAELQAPKTAADRPPLSLVLALDTSGSMEGEKLRHVVASVEFLAQQLLPHDRVGIVCFSHAARTLLSLERAGDTLPSRARIALQTLRAEGGTHVEAGLRLAAQLLGPCDGESRQAVLLLSDGLPNGGAMTPRTLAAIVRELKLSVSTLGYGADHSTAVLSALAEAGSGTYAYVPTPELCRVELARAVSQQADAAADGVRLGFRPGRGVSVERVLGAPTVGGFAESGLLEVPLPDFHSGERRAVAFALKLEPYAELGPATLGTLTLHQRGGRPVEVEVRAEVCEATCSLDPAVHGLRLLCSAQDARVQATQLADARRFDEAKALLQRVSEEIRRAPASANGPQLSEMLEQLIDDAALMQQRPDADARAAFRRGQSAALSPRPSASPMLGAAFSHVPRARLIILEGAAPTEVPLHREMVLGRTAGADLQLQSSGVSRQHTRIVAAEGAFWVNDLGSSNGTLVNGVRVNCERLRDGDVLHVGPVKMLYREG